MALPTLGINGESGDSGTATLRTTLLDYPDYEVVWVILGEGSIVVDNVRIVEVATGQPVGSEDAERWKQTVSFYTKVPNSWTNVEGAYTISMPGFILEEGTIAESGDVLGVDYDWGRLNQGFPNIDLTARHGHAPGLADEVFISVLVAGIDPYGQPAYAGKHITLVGEDFYNLN